MTENIEHLKAIRLELADEKADTTDIKSRLRSIDSSIIDLRRNDLHGLQRLQRRLELNMVHSPQPMDTGFRR